MSQEIRLTIIKEADIPILTKVLMEQIAATEVLEREEKNEDELLQREKDIRWNLEIGNSIRRAAGLPIPAAALDENGNPFFCENKSTQDFLDELAIIAVELIRNSEIQAVQAVSSPIQSPELLQEQKHDEVESETVNDFVKRIIKIFISMDMLEGFKDTFDEFTDNFQLPDWFFGLLTLIQVSKGSNKSEEETNNLLKKSIHKKFGLIESPPDTLTQAQSEFFSDLSDIFFNIVKHLYAPVDSSMQNFVDALSCNTRNKIEPYFSKEIPLLDICAIMLTAEQEVALQAETPEFWSICCRVKEIQMHWHNISAFFLFSAEDFVNANLSFKQDIQQYSLQTTFLNKLLSDLNMIPENDWDSIVKIMTSVERINFLSSANTIKKKISVFIWQEKIKNHLAIISRFMRQHLVFNRLASGEINVEIPMGHGGMSIDDINNILDRVDSALSEIEKISADLRQNKILEVEIQHSVNLIEQFLNALLYDPVNGERRDKELQAAITKLRGTRVKKLRERASKFLPDKIQQAPVPKIWSELIESILNFRSSEKEKSCEGLQVSYVNERQAKIAKRLQSKLDPKKEVFSKSDQKSMLEKIRLSSSLVAQLDMEMGASLPDNTSQLSDVFATLLRVRALYIKTGAQNTSMKEGCSSLIGLAQDMPTHVAHCSLISIVLVLVGFCLNAGQREIAIERNAEGNVILDLQVLYHDFSKERAELLEGMRKRKELSDNTHKQLVRSERMSNAEMTPDQVAFREFVANQKKMSQILIEQASDIDTRCEAEEEQEQAEKWQLLTYRYKNVLPSEKERLEEIRFDIGQERYEEAKEGCANVLKIVKNLETKLLVHLIYIEIHLIELMREHKKKFLNKLPADAGEAIYRAEEARLAKAARHSRNIKELACRGINQHRAEAEKVHQQWTQVAEIGKEKEDIDKSTSMVSERSEYFLKLLERRELVVSQRLSILEIGRLRAQAFKSPEEWHQNKSPKDWSSETKERIALEAEIKEIRKLKRSMEQTRKVFGKKESSGVKTNTVKPQASTVVVHDISELGRPLGQVDNACSQKKATNVGKPAEREVVTINLDDIPDLGRVLGQLGTASSRSKRRKNKNKTKTYAPGAGLFSRSIIPPQLYLPPSIREFTSASVRKLNKPIRWRGGAVRGMIRNEQPKDWDSVVDADRSDVAAPLSFRPSKHFDFLTTGRLPTGEHIDMVSSFNLPLGWSVDFTVNQLELECVWPTDEFRWFDKTCEKIIKMPREFKYIQDIHEKKLRVLDLEKIPGNPCLILKALEMIWHDKCYLDPALQKWALTPDLEKWVQKNGAQVLRNAIQPIERPKNLEELAHVKCRSIILYNIEHKLKPLMNRMDAEQHNYHVSHFLKKLNLGEVMDEIMVVASREALVPVRVEL
ncbi:MAG: hypothetical protein K0Q74_769 [Gammaproteobacteria bacterium]|nr:hypothetical protein [Gammaproteobacteria bacterium]